MRRAVTALAPRAVQPATRALSTAAVAERGPLRLFGYEGAYAHALFSAAQDSKKLDRVVSDLTSFVRLVESDKTVRSFIENPAVSPQMKLSVLGLDKSPMEDITRNFLQLVCVNKRLGHVLDIVKSFQLLVTDHRKESFAKIITAESLTADQKKTVEATLPKLVGADRKISVAYEVDPKTMGGLVLDIDGNRADLSVSSRLQAYRRFLAAQGHDQMRPRVGKDLMVQAVEDFVKKKVIKQRATRQ